MRARLTSPRTWFVFYNLEFHVSSSPFLSPFVCTWLLHHHTPPTREKRRKERQEIAMQPTWTQSSYDYSRSPFCFFSFSFKIHWTHLLHNAAAFAVFFLSQSPAGAIEIGRIFLSPKTFYAQRNIPKCSERGFFDDVFGPAPNKE